jgi:simple sugar transport system permease protein
MTPQTSTIPAAAEIPRMSSVLEKIGIDFPHTNPLNVSIFLALVCVFLVQFILTRTTFGYRVRAVGLNPRAAEYAGINVFAITLGAMAVSGALAGLVGVNEAMGFRHRFLDNFSGGIGFMGIAVALLGRNNPFGVLAAAILFGILNTGALEIDVFTDVPRELILVLQAVIIILVVVVNQVLMWQFERVEKQRLMSEGDHGAVVGSY